MRVKVGFTPVEQVSAPLGIVIDVLRATSTICQALASGYRRVLCCAEIDEARALAESEGPAKLHGWITCSLSQAWICPCDAISADPSFLCQRLATQTDERGTRSS